MSNRLKAAPVTRRMFLPVLGKPIARTVSELYPDHGDAKCIWCGRRRSVHADPIDVGGEFVEPACERINGGGKFEANTEARPRSPSDRLRIAISMPVFRARAIAGSLGAPSKMPGAAYGIDAFQCQKGSELAEDPTSVCFGCYARKNFYKHWWPALKARGHRQRAITHDLWVEAMICQIVDYVGRGGEPAFRWHDSGDLHGAWHLANIAAVCESTPNVMHWLPTREYQYVEQFLAAGGVIPSNLTVRLSAHYIGTVPDVPRAIAHLPTSTVHHDDQPMPIKGKGAIGCRAIEARENQCRGCRACWDSRVRNVSYPLH